MSRCDSCSFCKVVDNVCGRVTVYSCEKIQDRPIYEYDTESLYKFCFYKEALNILHPEEEKGF